MSDYAWIITTDHLFDPSAGAMSLEDEAGTMGPSDAPDKLTAQLEAGKGRTFTMFDDDGVKYYTGRLVTLSGDIDGEPHMVAPLRDFGGPNAGAVLIKWAGHPEWTCEY